MAAYKLGYLGDKVTDVEVVKALWHEPTTMHINGSYRVGFINNILIVLKSLFGRDEKINDALSRITPHNRIAFCVFKNEIDSASRNAEALTWDRLIVLNQGKLNFLAKGLGWGRVIKLSLSFMIISRKLCGAKAPLLFAHPMLAFLLYTYLSRTFKTIRPAKLIIFNLLHPIPVAILKAARNNDLSVEYCEHAATTSLMLRDIAELDRFWLTHLHTAELLVRHGVPSFKITTARSGLQKTPIPKAVERIGICINDLDKLSEILAFSRVLFARGISATYRVHDADRRYTELRNQLTRLGHTVASARDSSIFDYFKHIDLLIAGNSNVVGDAIEFGLPVLYIWLGDPELKDYYGYITAYGLDGAYTMRDAIDTVTSLVCKG